MVGLTRQKSQTTTEENQITRQRNQTSSARSVDAYDSDPDLLIKEYFRSSPSKRTKSRKNIARYINYEQSVLEILRIGASGEYREGYDGAIALLAEIDDILYLMLIALTLKEKYCTLAENSSTRKLLDSWLEILIKAVATAYRIKAKQRLCLIKIIITVSNRRTIKATIIDALGLIADEIDLDSIKEAIKGFTSDKDQYIRNYAEEALQDLS